MRENKVVYGLIGYGGMGRWHTEILSNVPEAVIGGIYDIKEEKRADIDVVLIATPNDCHKPIAIRAMHAGKNVISEKPVTLSSADLLEMENAAKETGKLLTVHQNRRWDDDFLIIKKLVEEQKLGHVFRIESRVHGSRGIPGDWRKEKVHGGGMVLDWGVHLLDQILYMYGDRKIETVYASLTNVTNQEVDDGFTAILTFEGGTEVLVEVGTNNYISLPRWYVLAGMTEETVVPVKTAAGLTKTMAPRREDTIVKEDLPKVSGDIADFHRNVVAVIRDGAEPEIKLFQVMRVMKLMEAIFQSAETNQVIEFQDQV
ncbi:gfo/Idh/MocA family oxidoreductase [Blautia sp. MCC289]|nr:gfo/Idh/MocA family oxidoreductase [Blautia sp. MCC289]